MNPSSPGLAQRAVVWLVDGLLIGLFMVAVGVFVPLLASPASPLAWAIEGLPDIARRAGIGVAMGLTAVTLIRSPLGALSGAHLNPSVTLAYLALGKIRPLDAMGYVASQLVGASLGVWAIGAVVGSPFTAPPVAWAPTVPGVYGAAGALVAEVAMAAGMMAMVLATTNHPRWARATPFLAGTLVATYITLFAPFSGMSLNPARTLASAFPSGRFDALWVYLLGPVASMSAVALAHRRLASRSIVCCKLNHDHPSPCIHCGCSGPLFPSESA